MTPIGVIAQIWRYPVKGMRGGALSATVLDAHGIAGDRRFAFTSSAAPPGAPLLASRERTSMLLYRAALAPVPSVTAPDGTHFDLPSADLLQHLQHSVAKPSATLGLHQSHKPITDVRPVALISTATLRALSEELGEPLDPQRFRSNLILALDDDTPFAEDALSGRTLRLGATAELRIRERIPRCRIVSLDPLTATPHPTLLRHLARFHEGRTGMYAQVQTPGPLAVGDAVWSSA